MDKIRGKAKTVLKEMMIPLSVVTTLLGVVLFVVLLFYLFATIDCAKIGGSLGSDQSAFVCIPVEKAMEY